MRSRLSHPHEVEVGRSVPSTSAGYGERMKIALAQINTTPDVSANVGKVEDYVRSAAEAGAVLVQFPEATMRSFGPGLREDTQQHAAAWQERMQALSDEHKLTIVAGEFLAHGDRAVSYTHLTLPTNREV